MSRLRAIIQDGMRLYPPGAGRTAWRVAYYDADGARRWVRLTATTQPEARKQLARLADAVRRDPTLRDHAAKPVPTLSQWRDQYVALLSDRRPSTRVGVAGSIRKFIAWKGDCRLDAVTPLDGEQWVASMQAEGMAKITARTNAARVKAWLAKAADLELIDRNPFRNLPTALPKVDAEWPWIDDADMAKLLNACPSDGWRRLLALCRWGGLRRGEAMRATWAEIRDGHLMVNATGARTTKRRARAVKIDGRLAKALGKPRSGLICAGTLKPKAAGPALATIYERAGFVPPKNPLHVLRRCCACDWIQLRKIDPFTAASMLGHSPAVSQGWYFRSIGLLPRLGKCDPAVTKRARRTKISEPKALS